MEYLIAYLILGLAWSVVMWFTVPVDDPFWTPGMVLTVLVASVFIWPLLVAYGTVAAGLMWRRTRRKTQEVEPEHPAPELQPNEKWDNYIKAGK